MSGSSTYPVQAAEKRKFEVLFYASYAVTSIQWTPPPSQSLSAINESESEPSASESFPAQAHGSYDKPIELARVSTWHSLGPLEALPHPEHSLSGETGLNPFNNFPVPLNGLQQRLLNFLIHDYRWISIPMSPPNQPGMKRFMDVFGDLPGLHSHLSSAAAQLRHLHQSETTIDSRQLELVALYHKGEAIREINRALPHSVSERLIIATITLARDELRFGSPRVGKMHFEAARRMLATIGGRRNIAHPHLLEQVRGIECLHPDPEVSALFDRDDLPVRIAQLKTFINIVRRKWIERRQQRTQDGLSPGSIQSAHQVLEPESLLHHFLSKEVPDPSTSWDTGAADLHAQLVVLMSTSAFWLRTADVTEVRNLFQQLNTMLDSSGIQKNDSVINAHTVIAGALNENEIQEEGRIWFTTDIMNAVRHLSFLWKVRLRDWLVRLLEGRRSAKLGRLIPSAFSYAVA